jgi:hypothetical protein
MRPLLVQLARLGAAILALYVGLLGVSLLAVPLANDSPAPLDSGKASSSLYLTEPKYVFMARSRLATPADKLLVLGASNSLVGFKPRELAPLLPELEVHNLAVGGSNITQLDQIVELVREVQTPDQRRHDTFVLGLWYGVFASDRARWNTPDRHAGDTDIDIERYRYGFCRRGDNGAAPLLPPQYLRTGAALIHPYLVADQLARDVTQSLRERLQGKPPKLTDQERNAKVVTEPERQKHLAFWREYMGSVDHLSDAGFERLVHLVDTVLADGARVVLVDMPIPRWHAQGSPLHADYARRMARLLPELEARDGVAVLRLTGDQDDEFSDEVHPKPRVTAGWAQALAALPFLQHRERDEHEYRTTLRQADAGLSRRIR